MAPSRRRGLRKLRRVEHAQSSVHPETEVDAPAFARPRLRSHMLVHLEQNEAEMTPLEKTKATFARLELFRKQHAERLRHDRILTPRTIFHEVYTKKKRRVTERDRYLLNTYIDQQNEKWKVQKKAAIEVQCAWRRHFARKTLIANRHLHNFLHDIDLATRRARQDRLQMEELQNHHAYVEAQAKRRREEREKRHRFDRLDASDKFLLNSLTDGTLKERLLEDRQRALLESAARRFFERLNLQSAYRHMRMREAWQLLVRNLKIWRWHEARRRWYLKRGFAVWREEVQLRLRIGRLLRRISRCVVHNSKHMALRVWRRNTRRNFRIVRGRHGARALMEAGRVFPMETAVLI